MTPASRLAALALLALGGALAHVTAPQVQRARIVVTPEGAFLTASIRADTHKSQFLTAVRVAGDAVLERRDGDRYTEVSRLALRGTLTLDAAGSWRVRLRRAPPLGSAVRVELTFETRRVALKATAARGSPATHGP